ncbi:hypothetical protein [Spongiactinospora sp. TRM90649]|uniref:hypothetical protein n=1 Tax=Spongiactinospora sp. TRM90649 TaxID=3031114 RepID=UPI0023F97229|nr:hypothetical protein [Spongiactinospora sp. TRM90649]MDF5759403.1 hypothetical protein [Spongiactinospora sp. TRM90649]
MTAADCERAQIAELTGMSRLAWAKHTRVRVSARLLLAAVVVLTTTLPLGGLS